MYHNLNNGKVPRIQLREHHVQDLYRQLHFLKKHFTLLPLREWFEVRNSTRSPVAAITFDDGLVNNLLALPVLESLNVPATFFVCTPSLRGESVLWPDALDVACHLAGDFVDLLGTRFERRGGIHMNDTGIRPAHFIKHLTPEERWRLIDGLSNGTRPWTLPPWNQHFPVMDAAGVRALAASSLVEIGSHGIAHQNLAHLVDEEVLHELRASKSLLESWTGSLVLSYAFADGSYNERTALLARDCGYRYLCAVVPQPYAVPDGIELTGRYGFYRDRHWTGQLHAFFRYIAPSA